MEPDQDHAPVLTPREARQGRRGRRWLVVLAVSTVLVVIAFAIVHAVWALSLERVDLSPAVGAPPAAD